MIEEEFEYELPDKAQETRAKWILGCFWGVAKEGQYGLIRSEWEEYKGLVRDGIRGTKDLIKYGLLK